MQSQPPHSSANGSDGGGDGREESEDSNESNLAMVSKEEESGSLGEGGTEKPVSVLSRSRGFYEFQSNWKQEARRIQVRRNIDNPRSNEEFCLKMVHTLIQLIRTLDKMPEEGNLEMNKNCNQKALKNIRISACGIQEHQEIDQLSMILSTISDASRLRTSGEAIAKMRKNLKVNGSHRPSKIDHREGQNVDIQEFYDVLHDSIKKIDSNYAKAVTPGGKEYEILVRVRQSKKAWERWKLKIRWSWWMIKKVTALKCGLIWTRNACVNSNKIPTPRHDLHSYMHHDPRWELEVLSEASDVAFKCKNVKT
nr:transferase, chloramphenicol acetyltransferase-like domain protein [Tanacetum cinerariifolium]